MISCCQYFRLIPWPSRLNDCPQVYHSSECPEQTAVSSDGIVSAGQFFSSNPGMAQRQGSPRNRPDGDVYERSSPSFFFFFFFFFFFLLPIAGAKGSSSKCPCPGLDTMENNLSLSSSLTDSPCNAGARDLPRPRNPILYWTPAEPWFIKIQRRAFLWHPLSFFGIHDLGPTSSTPWPVFIF